VDHSAGVGSQSRQAVTTSTSVSPLAREYAPHASEWVLYVDGEEAGRVAQRDDIGEVMRTTWSMDVIRK
jgi:hypothetical protein